MSLGWILHSGIGPGGQSPVNGCRVHAWIRQRNDEAAKEANASQE